MKRFKGGKLAGRQAKYRGKDNKHGLAIRLTPFALRERYKAMTARGDLTFYDYVEELIREDLGRLGIEESKTAARARGVTV